MKNKIVLLLLLSMAVTAQAGLKIYVNLSGNLWAEYADSKLTIDPSDTIKLAVIDDGVNGVTNLDMLAMGIQTGPGTLDIGNATVSDGVTAGMSLDTATAERLGIDVPFLSMELDNFNGGYIVQEIDFHCDGPGDVTIVVVDNDGFIQDAQVIHQTPEPATMILLGLGGLLLRKRT